MGTYSKPPSSQVVSGTCRGRWGLVRAGVPHTKWLLLIGNSQRLGSTQLWTTSVSNLFRARSHWCLPVALPGRWNGTWASCCLALCTLSSPVGVSCPRAATPTPRPPWEPHWGFPLARTVHLVSRLPTPAPRCPLGLAPTLDSAAGTHCRSCQAAQQPSRQGHRREGRPLPAISAVPLWPLDWLEMVNVLIAGLQRCQNLLALPCLRPPGHFRLSPAGIDQIVPQGPLQSLPPPLSFLPKASVLANLCLG